MSMQFVRWFRLLPVAFIAVATVVQAAGHFSWASPMQVPGFPGLRAELQHLADLGGHRRVNHFCVVVRQFRAARRSEMEVFALAYWPEEHSIQGFGPTRYRALDDTAMAGAPSIDLHEDVVGTADQINGSTSRVLHSDVEQIIQHCNKVGVKMTIICKGLQK